MSPTALRSCLVLGVLPLIGLASSPPAHAAEVVQAETGSLQACGDDGPMVVATNPSGIPGTYVFHPGSGCEQRFATALAVYTIESIRYFMTGHSGDICGHFEVSGVVPGETPTRCATGGTIITASFATNYNLGDYTITWVTDDPSPNWANAFVDHHVRTRVV